MKRLRFQTTWEGLCEVRSEYETKCKNRIQRQLKIGNFGESLLVILKLAYFFYTAGYSFNDEDIESAMISGTSVFSKEVRTHLVLLA